MPTYEYECPDGHLFEKFQKMTDKPRVKCPVCAKTAVRKISGGAGLVFKGSGFYITDYGKDGKGPRKAESEKSSSDSKPDTKTDTTPPSKSDTKPAAESAAPKAPKPTVKRGEGKASSE